MMMKFAGKVALITGGAQGLGRVFSEALLKRGAKVCMADIDDKTGLKTLAQFQQQYGQDSSTFVKCDVTSENELKNAFSHTKQSLGGLDILCNNAGIVNEIDWRKTIDINLIAVMTGTYLGLEAMRKDRGGNGGVIINVASVAGIISISEGPSYTASKFGVVGFSKAMGEDIDYPTHQVRVNCLCPTFADTPILHSSDRKVTKSSHYKLYKKRKELLGVMDPHRVGDAFIQLVEDESQNGSVLTVTRDQIRYKKYPPPLTLTSKL
ncbi:15-hydroxyprostaglandin dehydrogenase [NAD(+)]-like [Lingula anatina]|uniref:15-hydroxyprostaglandin dehydrogenase [NAD(+)] n=1 Tax=Lingula anatina TaxID=7574 RepID=A0A1S3IGD8_LINAN|nr:15-hydroxyprostaglandin dehydrogenase [NAD(+)]-like [Lingula anatina]|eukprot:XP_013396931.1 15-hydroxyprostaglandin dehydrogenase [NAD(+)]-like [Lingula anatina]